MKRTYLIFAVVGLLIGFAIGYGLLPKGPSGILTEERVEFYHEVGSAAVWGDMEGFGTTLVSLIPTTFSQTFKMSTITTHEDGRESITRHTHRFRAQLARETTILVFISATEPIDFKVVLLVGREAGGDFVYRTILHAPNITSYHDLFRVRESGVYKFVFERTQVKPVATVTFTALDVSSSPIPAIVSSGQRSCDM